MESNAKGISIAREARRSRACDASSGLVPGAGVDSASPIGRLRLSLADLRNDIGAVDYGRAQSNASPSKARQQGAAVFIDMRNVA